jgi:ribonuclease HI
LLIYSKAAIIAISQAICYGSKELVLKTDSKLMINTMTVWINGWKRNGWRRPHYQPIMNEQEIRKLDELCSKIKIEWVNNFPYKNLRI